jgi:hypothetical protein
MAVEMIIDQWNPSKRRYRNGDSKSSAIVGTVASSSTRIAERSGSPCCWKRIFAIAVAHR